MNWSRTAVVSLLLLPAALVTGPSLAAAADATLYEVTENVLYLDASGHPTDPSNPAAPRALYRASSSAIEGTAAAGSKVCPMPRPCYVVALGSDDIDINLGSEYFGGGRFTGEFSLVANEPSTLDAPEVVVSTGAFAGNMDLTPALLYEFTNGAAGAPIGTITGGGWCQGPGCRIKGTGELSRVDGALDAVFRLPFRPTGLVRSVTTRFLRVPFGQRLPVYYWVDGRRVPVRSTETVLGYPAVRIEVNFR